MAERYAFIVEWLDPHAGLTFKYQLMFYKDDNSIEMYDIKNRRTFLKKVVYPSVKAANLYIGSTITVYSRQLKVVEYADAFTEKALETTRQSVFVLVKPAAIPNLGKIVNAIMKSDFVVAQCKMAKLTPQQATALYGSKEGGAALVSEITSGPVVGMALVADGAVEKFSELMGAAGDGNPETIMAHFGPACVGSASPADVPAELSIFFSCESACKLTDTSLCLVKPSSVEYLGLLLDGVLANFDITGLQTFTLDRANAMEFYEVYKGVVPEYNSMVDELTSGPFVGIEVAAPDGSNPVESFRELVGPMDPEIARVLRPNSLRAKFGFDKVKNAVHCTDLTVDGALETHYFFKILAA